MNVVRRWWPVPALLVGSFVIQKAYFESHYDVSGHAGEHLMSAGIPFLGAALIGILLFVTPRARRQPLMLATAAAWLAATVVVLVGNLRVVDALVSEGLARVSTDDLVQSAAVDSAHDLANSAPMLGIGAALALTAVLWRYGHISRRVAISALVLSVIFPPWMFPGAGVLVVTIARCIAHQRAARGDLRVTTAQPVTVS
jgi:hypothetical protein